jgi:hypothetical protein
MDGFKVYVLKGNTNGSGVITSNTTTAFVVKSDSNTDIEATSGSGSLLGTDEIYGTPTNTTSSLRKQICYR